MKRTNRRHIPERDQEAYLLYSGRIIRKGTQIERLQTLNNLTGLTPEIVNTARQALLIGHSAP